MPENKKKYTGAWCPSITPFDADGKLDLAALEKHFSRLSEAGTDGVLLMGSIGEFTALSMDERVSLIHAARTMTHLPLIANVSGTCMEDMTRLADAAYSEGYEAVMALPHYYFAQTPRQLEAYFDTLGGRFEGEWLIYNFPARTGCDVDAALIAKLAARFPRFMGVKDTVDCASHTRAIVRAADEVREDFSVLCGFDEYFIPNLMNGGDGVLSGLNNVVPELFTQAKTAFRSGQFEDLCAAHREIGRLSSIYTIGDDFVTTIKAAVAGEKWAKEKVIEHYTPMIDELVVNEDMKQHLILKLLEELPHFPMGQA